MKRLSRIAPLMVVVLLLFLSGCGGGGAAQTGGSSSGDGGGAEETPSAQVVITEESAANEVVMVRGEQAVVKLNPAYNWDIVATPSLVLDKVPDAQLKDGEQALLEAKFVGSAVIQATGKPACAADNPPCPTPPAQLLIKVRVTNPS